MTSMPLTKAVRDKNLARVVALLRGPIGADVDFERDDDQGLTPLGWAALEGQLAIVSALLARGADPGAADVDGHTPIEYARKRKHAEVVALLESLTSPPAKETVEGEKPAKKKPAKKKPAGDAFEAVLTASSAGRYHVEVPAAAAATLGAKVRVSLNDGASVVRPLDKRGSKRLVRLLPRDIPEGVDEGSAVRVRIAPFPA